MLPKLKILHGLKTGTKKYNMIKFKTPANSIARFFFCFVVEVVTFFLLCANFRAVAQGLYVWTAITDMIIVFNGMLITKMLFDDEKSRDWISIAGYTLGGATGSVISIWVTKHVFGV
jgi:hypothetical protein